MAIDPTSSEIDKRDRIVYDGGRNPSYDLTGVDPRFKKEYDFVIVFQAGQIHTFPIPVYLDSIKVYRTVGSEQEEVQRDETGVLGTWRVAEVATEAMSKAYLLDNDGSFNKQLIKSIEFNLMSEGATTSKITVAISSQRFYLDLYDLNGFDGVGPSYTPGLGRWILDKLQALEAMVATNLSNTFACTDTANDMLEEDLTGTLPANYVNDEDHEVNVASGVDTLMPARGSFYSHDFKMFQYTVRTGTVQMANKKYNLENQAIFIYKETSTVGNSTSKITTTRRVYLSEQNYDNYLGMAGSFIDRAKLKIMVNGEDYEFTNLNVAKTEKSESEYGVYDTIRLLKAISGNVLITYHAFGGAVVFEDVYDMRQDILNTMKILSSKNLVTSDIFDKQPVIIDILNRIQLIEQYHNHFNRVEHAIYRGQKGYHWFDIAVLYDLPWEEAHTCTDEVGTFRVESLDRRWCYEFSLSIDLKKRLVDMLRCKTIGTNDVFTATLKDYMKLQNSRDDVGIRVCWIGDGTNSGLTLQLGWNFDNYKPTNNGVDTDTLIVTNKSGMTSKWRLVYNPIDNTYESKASAKDYNHVKYIITQDDTYKANKKYFQFEKIFTYYRTGHQFIREGVQYFTVVNDPIAGTSVYRDVTAQLVVGHPVSEYTAQAAYRNGLYERVIYKSIPKLMAEGSYTVGNVIENRDEVYEVSDGSYNEDTTVQLPNQKCTWIEGTTGCYSCQQLLEPSDGVVAWAGTYPLHVLNLINGQAKSQILGCWLRPDTQKVIDISTIKGVTFKLYDRKLDLIVNRTADIGLAEAVYESVQQGDVAVADKDYYVIMRGSVNDISGNAELTPIKYVKANVAIGAQLIPGVHFVTKVQETLFNGGQTTKVINHTDRIFGQVIFDLLDLCGSYVEVYKNQKGYIDFRLTPFMGTDSVINERFDLRQIELHF